MMTTRRSTTETLSPDMTRCSGGRSLEMDCMVGQLHSSTPRVEVTHGILEHVFLRLNKETVILVTGTSPWVHV